MTKLLSAAEMAALRNLNDRMITNDKMSDTPRTDALYDQFGPVADPAAMAQNSLARELERELNAARDLLARTRGHISDGKLDALIAAEVAKS